MADIIQLDVPERIVPHSAITVTKHGELVRLAHDALPPIYVHPADIVFGLQLLGRHHQPKERT